MSDSSSLSSIVPSDAKLESALRDAVKTAFSTGNLENLTVKRIRAAVERELDLRDGFFKEAKWKDRSKSLIETEAQNHDPISTPTVKAGSSTKPKPSRPEAQSPSAKQSTKKRKIIESIEHDEEEETVTRPIKRKSQSKIMSEDEDDDFRSAQTLLSPDKVVQNVKTSTVTGKENHTGSSNAISPHKTATSVPSKSQTALTEEDLGDSDLSEVFDEMPKPKRKKQTNTKKKAVSKQEGQSKPKDLDPQADEIKSLQGWLVKCGVRKVWGKELKPYETPREKIKHLKEMLSDIGMTGRFSKEKAESIREARELAADLEAVQEGAKLWGKDIESSDRGTRVRTTKNVLSEFDYMDDEDD